MASNWYFLVGFTILCLALTVDAYILRLQVLTLRKKSKYQPVKKLLIAAIATIMIASMPLAFVYADILWFHLSYLWIVVLAVIGNSIAKLLFAIIYLMIYRY